MPASNRRSTLWLWVAAAVALLVVWFVPVDVSPSLHLPAKLLAGSEWTVERSGQGTVTARVEDRLDGVTRRYLVQSVDRGDIAELVFRPGIRAGGMVAAGDTVAVLRSTATEARLAEVEGLVSVSASELSALEAGEKETRINEARRRLERVRTLIGVQERIVERLRQLSSTGAAAEDELDRAMAGLLALEGEADVTEAQIAVLESGARPADLRLASTRLDAARAQLEALSAQRAALVITAPMPGLVSLPPGDSVLVRVIDMTRWVVLIPVPVAQRAVFDIGREVVLDASGMRASIRIVDPTVRQVGGRPVVTAVAEGLGERPDALDHETVAVRMEGQPVRLRTWFVNELRDLFRWENWFGHAERV